ncbi:WhiB family transcriptional regulator [Nonomuraea sp. MG754425]|uniref:WhiB family transcriptional regulator n=1 Tax=Nonomuraea sp. MG754425 TaxID=2570319 RepID=UPI001F3FDF5D|nr:WhiB family transcriptional regulator [Nonomuraea sp. MG754425]MCF6467346.1 WhiB family transcriptional regulator [Nonomuraea sp. MG754425]
MSPYRPSRELRLIGSIDVPQEPEWFRRGACYRIGHELFFGPSSDGGHRETPREKEERENRARALCDECPVLAQCKDYATSFSNGLQVGVWHGGNDHQRKLDRRKEQRRTADQSRRERQTS